MNVLPRALSVHVDSEGLWQAGTVARCWTDCISRFCLAVLLLLRWSKVSLYIAMAADAVDWWCIVLSMTVM